MVNSSEWLSLSEVAERIGVHPSTVRSWADQGHLPVHRTQGGHRRFRLADVEAWQRSRKADPAPLDLMIQHALRRTRLELGEGKLEGQEWYAKLDSEARDQYRLSGRSLVLGMIGVLSDAECAEAHEAEARSLGFEYAARGRRYDLSHIEAVMAFLFFRNLLVDSMLNYYVETGVNSAQVWSDMVRRSQAFTDQILMTLLQTYETYQRNGQK